MEDAAELIDAVDRACRLLVERPGLKEVRVFVRSLPDYGTLRECVNTARRHGLRCWISGHTLVIALPDALQAPGATHNHAEMDILLEPPAMGVQIFRGHAPSRKDQ